MAETQVGGLSVESRGQIIQGLGAHTKELELYYIANGKLLEGGKHDYIWNLERSFCEQHSWWLERTKTRVQEFS